MGVWLFLFLSGGCALDFDSLRARDGGRDGGTMDAGREGGLIDAGRSDGGAPDDGGDVDGGGPGEDAASPDAGLPDAGEPDAGAPDAGAPDAGAPDAGAPDAGLADAGTPDTGVSDAGAPDACVTMPEDCASGRDEDCDGFVDCTDNDCAEGVLCPSGGHCCGSSCVTTFTSDASCGGCGLACIGGTCLPAGGGPFCTCISDAQCPGGQTCDAIRGCQCRGNEDCAAGQICAGDRCFYL